MPISYVGAATTTWAARANTSVGVPAGVASGDLLILGIITGAAEAVNPTAPAGWTAIGTAPITDIAAGGFNVEMTLYRRLAASESGSYAFTHASTTTQAWMLAYRGVDATTPMDVTQTVGFVNGSGAGTATTTWTGLTTATPGAWIVAIEHDWGDLSAASAPPTGMTERIDIDIVYVADQEIAAAGATGNRTHTNSSTSPDSLWSAVLLALRPASAGAVDGAAAVTAPAATASAAGAVRIAGSGAATAPAASAAGAAGLSIAGAAAVTAPAASASGTTQQAQDVTARLLDFDGNPALVLDVVGHPARLVDVAGHPARIVRMEI